MASIRSLLVLLMSIAVVCYSVEALHATTPLVSLDTTSLTVAADTLVTLSTDTLLVEPSDELAVTPQIATQELAAEREELSGVAPAVSSKSKPSPRITVDKGARRSGEVPFIQKVGRWFTRYPNSGVALLCSIVPGGGQLYNQRYWKMPIVLSAMTAGIYAISWNQRLYNEYHTAYADLLSENPLDHTSWQAFIPAGADPSQYVSDGNLRSRLERGSKQYKESRDMGIVITVALYLLSALDAYVDAELYYFNVSPQLTIDMGDGLRDKPSGPRPHSVMVGASVRF